MFRNSPEMGGGGIACLGPTTIIGRTIYIRESSSGATLDDPWVFAGPINQPSLLLAFGHCCEGLAHLLSLFCFLFLFFFFSFLWKCVHKKNDNVLVLYPIQCKENSKKSTIYNRKCSRVSFNIYCFPFLRH